MSKKSIKNNQKINYFFINTKSIPHNKTSIFHLMHKCNVYITSTKDHSFFYSRIVAAVATVTKPNINDRSTSTKDQHFMYSRIERGTGCTVTCVSVDC